MKAIGLLVIGVLLGLSAGYLLWFRGEVATAQPGGVITAESAPRLPVEGSPSPDSARTVESRQYHESLSEMAERLEPLPKAQGTGEIRGQVHFESGEPAPGVTIRLSPLPGRPAGSASRRRGDPLPSSDLGWRVRQRIAEEQDRLAREWEGTTDAAGEFVATGLVGEHFVAAAYLLDHEVVPRVGTWPSSIPIGTQLDLVAKPLVGLTVVVEMASGEPIEMAVITCTQGEQRFLEKWTPSEPVLRLLPGDYVLDARVDGPVWAKSDRLNVQLRAGSEVQPVRLVLKSQTGLRGRVVFPEGWKAEPTGGYFLFYRRLGTDEAASKSEFSLHETYQSITPPRNMDFVLTDVSPGRWVLALAESEKSILLAVEAEVVPGRMTEKDVVIPASFFESALRVDVRGPGGLVVSDARLEVRWTVKGGREEGVPVQQRGPDGRFLVVRRPATQTSPASTPWLKAISPRYGEVLHPLPPPEQSELTLHISESGSLRVQLSGTKVLENHRNFRLELDKVLSPGSGALARRPSGDPGQQIDERGTADFPVVQPGDYELRLYWHSRTWSRGLLLKRRITIAPGKNEAEFAVPDLHELVVDMKSVSGASLCDLILLSAGGEGGESIQSQPWTGQETLRFEGLAAGNYAIRSHSGEYASVVYVTVPTEGSVPFRPIRPGALRILGSDGNEVLSKLGVLPGDRIVALEGKPISEISAPDRAVLRRASEASTLGITLERGGSRFDLNVDSAQFRSATGNGRLLLPWP